MKTIKAVVFDYFGVICTDQYEHWLREHNHSRNGKYKDIIQKTDSGELSMAEFYAQLAIISSVPEEQIKKDFSRNTDIDHRIIGLILSLKKYYKIGLLTNSSHDWIAIALDQFHLRSIFDEVVVSGDVGFIKPHQRIYEIMLDKLKADAGQVVFIDDRKVNVSAAEKLGMKGILYSSVEDLKHKFATIGVAYE